MRSFVTGLAYWGMALMASDAMHAVYVLRFETVFWVSLHIPMMAMLALMALPEMEVRLYYPCGSKIAPYVKAAQDKITERAPCLGSLKAIAVLSLYFGLASIPRSIWLLPALSYLGPLERVTEPFAFLWPTFTLMMLVYAVCAIIVVIFQMLMSLLTDSVSPGPEKED
mmetsp:Transcript_104050/g.233587  ORF Transcript_104050/g.233587 Transcript_104050/m.233587 type:complete len:168 (-) Transcript_104050:83-586(-)